MTERDRLAALLHGLYCEPMGFVNSHVGTTNDGGCEGRADRLIAAGVSLAALASPAAPADGYPDRYCAECGEHIADTDGTVFHGDCISPAAPRPEGLDDDRRQALAEALYNAAVRPETIWWDDLTAEMQDGWLRAADVAYARLSDTGEPE